MIIDGRWRTTQRAGDGREDGEDGTGSHGKALEGTERHGEARRGTERHG